MVDDKEQQTGVTSEPERSWRVPFIVGGRRRETSPNDGSEHTSELSCAHGGTVTLPAFDDNFADELTGLNRFVLDEIPVQEIVAFLNRVGALWKNDEYARRRLFIRQLCNIVGFSEEMAVAEADLIAVVLTATQRLWDSIAIELGDRHILDQWVQREDSQVRAFPRGMALNVLAGTVPTASVLSIVRSLITKNLTVAKMSSGDPVTASSLALSFLDCDADHPVVQALQVVYWPPSNAASERVADQADVLTVWGGSAAMEWASQHARGTELLLFGPKRSLALVDIDASGADLQTVARRVAHDVSMYDQNACFSTLQIFASGSTDRFIECLAKAFENYREILPPPTRSEDLRAGIHSMRRHHEFLGNRVEGDTDGDWTLVVCPPEDAEDPLGGRTLLVHPVESIDDALCWVDSTVQTVAVYPWTLAKQYGTALARRGAERVVEVGLSGIIRLGASHDGVYPLTRLVRLVCIEDPADRYGKGMVVPLELGEMLEGRAFRDLNL